MTTNEPIWTEDIEAAGGILNTVLYRMVSDYPDHSCSDFVRDKMLAIGRVYSATVTRGAGRPNGELDGPETDLYAYLADRISSQASAFDERISQCRTIGRISQETVGMVIGTHNYVENLLVEGIRAWQSEFNVHSKKQVWSRSSFTSKYLHFHAPMAFFILDKIVENELSRSRPRHSRMSWHASCMKDHKTRYGKHCIRLLELADCHYMRLNWTPRMIDGHLMGYIRKPSGLTLFPASLKASDRRASGSERAK